MTPLQGSIRLGRVELNAWDGLALAAAAFLLSYFVLRYVVGPLGFDEVYFSHSLWLVLQGQRQFVDFYSSHLPTYFMLLSGILPSEGPLDLRFIWIVRGIGVLVLFGYFAMLFRLERRLSLCLAPLLLVFITIGRMIEIRTDTFGLLLFNIAWAFLLAGYSRRNVMAACLLALAGVSFSARGGVMAVGFSATVAMIIYRHRDLRALIGIVTLGAVAAALATTAWFADQDYLRLVIRSVFIDPSQLFPTISIWQRFLAPDRAPLVALIVSGLAVALTALRLGARTDRALIAAVACTTQLLLILGDPSPFAYVYGWAAIPALCGLALLAELTDRDIRPWLAGAGACLASLLAGLMLAYIAIKGHQPPTGSILRLGMDRPLAAGALDRMRDEDLVRLMISGRGQQSLANQLAVRRAVCQRMRNRVLSAFPYHPICVPDAAYYWYEAKWPGAFAGASPAAEAEFRTLFESAQPELFIWSGRDSPQRLNGGTEKLISTYRRFDGFALTGGTGRPEVRR